MAGDTVEESPSIWFAALLVAAPIVTGTSLFLRFEAGAIHRPGLYLIGAGVIVGGFLALWRWTRARSRGFEVLEVGGRPPAVGSSVPNG